MKTTVEHWERKSDGANLVIDKTRRYELSFEDDGVHLRCYMNVIFNNKIKAILLVGDYEDNIEDVFELVKVYYVMNKEEEK